MLCHVLCVLCAECSIPVYPVALWTPLVTHHFCVPWWPSTFSLTYFLQSTGKRSALGTVREAELFGGVLSSSLSREHLALTAEFLRGDECVL